MRSHGKKSCESLARVLLESCESLCGWVCGRETMKPGYTWSRGSASDRTGREVIESNGRKATEHLEADSITELNL